MCTSQSCSLSGRSKSVTMATTIKGRVIPPLVIYMLFVSAMMVTSVSNAGFVHQPQPQSTTCFSGLYFLYYCEASVNVLQYTWRVNGEVVTVGRSDVIVHTEDNLSILDVLCSENMNVAQVECCYLMQDGPEVTHNCSTPATMTVISQNPVTNVSIRVTTTSFNVSWDPIQKPTSTAPPEGFSLDRFNNLRVDTNIDTSDVYYFVTVNGVRQPAVRNTSYIFSPPTSDSSQSFNFTVTAGNFLREGNASDPKIARLKEPTERPMKPTENSETQSQTNDDDNVNVVVVVAVVVVSSVGGGGGGGVILIVVVIIAKKKSNTAKNRKSDEAQKHEAVVELESWKKRGSTSSLSSDVERVDHSDHSASSDAPLLKGKSDVLNNTESYTDLTDDLVATPQGTTDGDTQSTNDSFPTLQGTTNGDTEPKNDELQTETVTQYTEGEEKYIAKPDSPVEPGLLTSVEGITEHPPKEPEAVTGDTEESQEDEQGPDTTVDLKRDALAINDGVIQTPPPAHYFAFKGMSDVENKAQNQSEAKKELNSMESVKAVYHQVCFSTSDNDIPSSRVFVSHACKELIIRHSSDPQKKTFVCTTSDESEDFMSSMLKTLTVPSALCDSKVTKSSSHESGVYDEFNRRMQAVHVEKTSVKCVKQQCPFRKSRYPFQKTVVSDNIHAAGLASSQALSL